MKIIYILLLLVTIGCTPVCNEIKFANKLINEQSNYLKQCEGLDTFGTGTSTPDKIHSLHLQLIKTDKLKISEVRKLYVRSVESFIDRINNDVNIRPYLIQYPVTHENIELGILFKNRDGTDVLPPYLAKVSMHSGKIFYAYYDKREELYSRDNYVEPYLEALEIVKRESNCYSD